MKDELKKLIGQLGIQNRLEEAGLESAQEIVLKSTQDLTRILSIDEASANKLLNTASVEMFDWRLKEKAGHELMKIDNDTQTTTTLTTGDKTIDTILNGGIPLGTITEIVGESSSGKTQLALQLCLTVQKPRLEGGLGAYAVYIHTEGRFPLKRLEQLIKSYSISDQEKLKKGIHVMPVTTSELQYSVLCYQLPLFIEAQYKAKKAVRLVVIDSISAVYRGETTKRFDRMTEICEIGTKLKKMASQFGVAIVAVNQVSDVPVKENSNNMDQNEKWMDFSLINSEDRNNMIGLYIQSLLKKPVLGLAWSNAVNTRIRLARSPMLENFLTRRILFLEFSPVASRRGCELAIDENGIHFKSA